MAKLTSNQVEAARLALLDAIQCSRQLSLLIALDVAPAKKNQRSPKVRSPIQGTQLNLF